MITQSRCDEDENEKNNNNMCCGSADRHRFQFEWLSDWMSGETYPCMYVGSTP